jgi:hypothetical protein
VTKFGLTRREVALVAGALLLPIPFLAATGLNVPLPGLVERAVASLLPGDVGVDEPGAAAVVPGSKATPARAATPASSPATPVKSLRGRGAVAGAASGLARTTVGGPIGVDAPGTGDPPSDGGTPSGGDPEPGADPVPEATPPPLPLPLPDTVPTAPDPVPDAVIPDAVLPDDTVPDDAVPEELPIDVSVGENGIAMGSDSGASVEVTTENVPGVDVETPPVLPTPPLSLP